MASDDYQPGVNNKEPATFEEMQEEMFDKWVVDSYQSLVAGVSDGSETKSVLFEQKKSINDFSNNELLYTLSAASGRDFNEILLDLLQGVYVSQFELKQQVYDLGVKIHELGVKLVDSTLAVQNDLVSHNSTVIEQYKNLFRMLVDVHAYMVEGGKPKKLVVKPSTLMVNNDNLEKKIKPSKLPAPPPPPPPAEEFNTGSLRGDIIAELKAVFAKKNKGQ